MCATPSRNGLVLGRVIAPIARRLILGIPVLFMTSAAVFVLLRLTPGDPVLMYVGENATPEVVAAVREEMGLDGPLPAQFIPWLLRVLRGELGESFTSGLPVMELIRTRLPATLELAGAAMFITLVVAFPIGVVAAVRRGGAFDVSFTTLSAIGLAVPNFWIGILLILLFALTLRWLPPGGYVALTADPLSNVRFLVMPAITLALPTIAVLGRFVRSSMLEVLQMDYVRTARSKGLREAVVLYRHALRNALIPTLTILGLQFGRMIGGAVIVETVFGWPGMGQLILQAVGNRDYVVVQGALLAFVTLFLAVSVLIDIGMVVVDPRLRGRAI